MVKKMKDWKIPTIAFNIPFALMFLDEITIDKIDFYETTGAFLAVFIVAYFVITSLYLGYEEDRILQWKNFLIFTLASVIFWTVLIIFVASHR